jgi:hypothetical protein
MDADKKTETDALADIIRNSYQGPGLIRDGLGRVFLVKPEGMTREEITRENALPSLLPDHISQAVTLETVESFGDYVNRFKTPLTAIFGEIAHNRIVAVMDYHVPPKPLAEGEAALTDVLGGPQFADHRATLNLPFSLEFKTWSGVSGKMMSQLDFARFLEENANDIIAPSGADLLEIARDLHAVRKVDFRKAVRTSTEVENFEYSDQTEAKAAGGVEVPTKFMIAIPVYFGEEPVTMHAFLRWNLAEGALSLGLVLHRAEHVRQAVFKGLVARVVEATSCPAVFGRLGA